MAERREPGAGEPMGQRPEELSGVKGGYAASPAMAMPYPELAGLRDRVRWSAIWAGLVIALVIQMILNALGVAIGLTAFKPTTTGGLPGSLDVASGIWFAISALIALFVGGYVAARMSGLTGRMNGFMHGIVVWGLSLILGSILIALGVSGLLGFIGNNLRLILDAMSGRVLGTTPTVGPQAARAIASYAASAAWWFIIGSILGLIAAAIGGVVGIRRAETTEPSAPVSP